MNSTIYHLKVATVWLSCILMLSSTVVLAQPSDKYKAQVALQLLIAAGGFEEMAGYELTHDPKVGKIYKRQGSKKFFTLRLDRGASYAILAVCDEDCSDIDLDLYDDNGNRIDFDHKTDDKAVVQVSPKWSAVFELKVTIPRCSAYRCTYGVGVFGK